MTYRNESLTRVARDAPCQVKLPGVCNGNPATSVWAHSNALEHGRGYAHPAHDCFGTIACSACHDAIDGRTSGLTKEWKRYWWRVGADNTVLYLWQNNLIKVA